MAFIRKVRTASGATAVQIAQYESGRRQKILKHLGSANTEAELGVLVQQAARMLEYEGQGEFDLGLNVPARKHRLAEPEDPGLFSQASGPAKVETVAPGRPMFHHKRESIEAHLTIVFTALAVGRYAQQLTGLSIRKIVRSLRPLRSATLAINGAVQTFAPQVPDDLVSVVNALRN